ncbi:hypothetical protein [Ruminococcus sp. HUN007]|uniref:hypothetical protein n=1 Tax=Ruminococcus sp. HUN007 TaxID=1514668 RepID=UPI0005D23C48|nr:hypothetical protein [Ruminococcus sp. HUN007]
MNTVPVILAAASLIVTKDELNGIAEYYNYFGEMSETHFDTVLSGKEYSRNQAALIYHCCYLYFALAGRTGNSLAGVRKKLGLPKSVYMNSLKHIGKKTGRFYP